MSEQTTTSRQRHARADVVEGAAGAGSCCSWSRRWRASCSSRARPSRRCRAAHSRRAAGDGFYGTLALPAKQAPPIHLRNYLGRPVTLSQYRGKAVLVTFLYANCPDICPLIASNLRVALNMLGRRDSEVQVIAVSVDPRGDTPANVAQLRAPTTRWSAGCST